MNSIQSSIDPQSRQSLLARLGYAGICLTLIAIINLPALGALATDYSDRLLQRALVAFAIARGVDSAVSMAQGTEVAFQPVGVGVTLAPGELLDPINDILEQLCDVLMWAAAIAGIQKLLLVIVDWWWINLVLSLALLGFAVAVWYWRPPRWLGATLALLLVLRLAVPMIALFNEAIYQLFLADRVEQASESLKAAEATVRGVNEQASPEPAREPPSAHGRAETSALDDVRAWWSNKVDALDPRPQMQALLQRVENAVTDALELMAVFLLQTVVLPLLLVWLMQRLMLGILAFAQAR